MCLIICLIIVFCILLISLTYWHRRRCVAKVLKLSYGDKSCLLCGILEPFGFSYLGEYDIFTTRPDAWQRVFGHESSSDSNALALNMVFDCEPVYFNYHGRTWLIEFWKGQYGISTGAEAGIYRADTIIPPMLRRQTVFEAISLDEMLPMKLRLSVPGCPLFQISRMHWWLAGFVTGICTHPEDLTLDITITFPDDEMCIAFVRSLLAIGYKSEDLTLGQTTIRFCLKNPKSRDGIPWDSWVESYVLWKAGIASRLFSWVTRPFSSQLDRMLFLWYYCPAVFRKTIRSRKF